MRIQESWMRGAGPLAVLKLLEEREMYGYELAEELDKTSDGILAMGHSTLYPLLYNLEAKGLIEHGTPRVVGGRKRKYYRLTAAGREWLDVHAREWTGLVRAMLRFGLA